VTLREKIAQEIWDGGKDEMHVCEVIADHILAIPEIKEALAALEREESYSSIFDDPGD
jgi:hypothetical protein